MPPPEINLPNNWKPRPHQVALWDYLSSGGKRAIEIAHRRWGKDDVTLHHTACAAHERISNYAHCLPEYTQARKVIWNAVNPFTGKRRIDEAFPQQVRESTNEHEMLIKFKCGSTWQLLGSDQYDRLVGTAFAGVVFSEWAVANPSAWGYIQPILAQNSGWAIFITTPRGRNHAYKMFSAAQNDPAWFTELSTVESTDVFSRAELAQAKRELVALYGEDVGLAQYEQEYLCSFNAPVMGAYYTRELDAAQREGRLNSASYQPALPVFTAWDIGWSDATAIWFWQVVGGEVHVIDFYSASGQSLEVYAAELARRRYNYETHWLPHDAKAKTLASGGRSIQEQLSAMLGYGKVQIVPNLGIEDGIQAVRSMFRRVWFSPGCDKGVDALSNYQTEWDDDKKCFKSKPLHDWTSHPADAFRYLAVVWQEAEQKRQGVEAGSDNTDPWGRRRKVAGNAWKTT